MSISREVEASGCGDDEVDSDDDASGDDDITLLDILLEGSARETGNIRGLSLALPPLFATSSGLRIRI